MAITYPISMPTNIGFAQISLRAVNAVAISQSPFTFATQVHAYSGEKWGADITIPPINRENAEEWVAFLTKLRGSYGTFLLGDPAGASPRGTATSATITGTSGSRSVTVAMVGTLLAGDYIQLGTGSDSTLHKVLEDQSGNGTLEIWPALRKNRTSVSATLTNPKGVFRLTSNMQNWTITPPAFYQIAFSAEEVI